MIIKYKASNIKGFDNKDVLIHKDFEKYCNQINDVLKQFNFTYWVTNSYREENAVIKGAIVTPANMSNHKVGFALDGNLQDNVTKEWYNSVKMGDGIGKDEQIILAIEKSGVRWGGRFKTKDSVHFDYPLNLNNPNKWKEIFNELNEKV